MALNRLKDSETRINNIDNFVKPSNPLNTFTAMVRNFTYTTRNKAKIFLR